VVKADLVTQAFKHRGLDIGIRTFKNNKLRGISNGRRASNGQEI